MNSVLLTALDQELVRVALLYVADGTQELLSCRPALVSSGKVLQFLAA
mgnify:FL=1